MSETTDSTETETQGAAEPPHELETLRAELEVVREENRRLRDSYVRAKRARFRRSAIGFLVVGLSALGGAYFFPAVRTLLLAFAGTGLFAAIITLYLTPERFVSATVSETVFDVLEAVEVSLVAELELQDESIYVPTPSLPEANVRLFIPQHVEYVIPSPRQLRALFVSSDVAGEQGVALTPTGDRLFEEFKRSISSEFDGDPTLIASGLTASLAGQFELVGDADFEVDPQSGHASISISDPVYGSVVQRDHPVVSFLAVGFAAGLDRPVSVETREDDRYSGIVTLTWQSESGKTSGQ